MSHHLKKLSAKYALTASLVRMLEVMREEHGDDVDGVACDLSMTQQGEFFGNLAALIGDIELSGETL